MTSPSAYNRMRSELKPGERLLWCGRPRGGILVRFGRIFPSLVLLVFTGIAIAGSAYVMAVIGCTVLAYTAFTAIYREPRQRRHTAYGLTDRRVIIVEGGLERRVKSLPLHLLTDVTLRERGDRSGTIACFITDSFLQRKNKRGVAVPESLFRLIVDARHVHDLLLDAQAKALARRG